MPPGRGSTDLAFLAASITAADKMVDKMEADELEALVAGRLAGLSGRVHALLRTLPAEDGAPDTAPASPGGGGGGSSGGGGATSQWRGVSKLPRVEQAKQHARARVAERDEMLELAAATVRHRLALALG